MDGVRITELPPLLGQLADLDLFEMVDVSDQTLAATGTNKKFTGSQLKQFVAWQLKRPVHTRTIAPVTLATALVPGLIVGGLLLEAGFRVLVTAQIDPGDNGIWVVQASGPPVRSDDVAVGMSLSGAIVPVGGGDGLGSFWACVSPIGSDIVGTDVLLFSPWRSATTERYKTFAFAWGDATPALLMTVAAGQMVLSTTISLDVAFDGVGSSLSVGDAGDSGSLLDADMIDPSMAGAFQNDPCRRFLEDTEVLLTIVPGTGATRGSGVVSLCLE